MASTRETITDFDGKMSEFAVTLDHMRELLDDPELDPNHEEHDRRPRWLRTP
jgi:hypothetical protein